MYKYYTIFNTGLEHLIFVLGWGGGSWSQSPSDTGDNYTEYLQCTRQILTGPEITKKAQSLHSRNLQTSAGNKQIDNSMLFNNYYGIGTKGP